MSNSEKNQSVTVAATIRKAASAALLAVSLLFATVIGAGGSASAQSQLENGPSALVISYKASAENRPAFRDYLNTTHRKMLDGMRKDGVLKSYRIFFSWYEQSYDWDAMVELQFVDSDAVAVWNELVKKSPAGLTAKGLSLATPVMTVAADVDSQAQAQGASDGTDAVYLVIPYTFHSTSEYRAYSRAYVLPQFEGWLKEGALSAYEVLINRYPAGTPWDSLIIQQYKDFRSFGQRDRVKGKVRAALKDNPEWVDFHQRKGDIREETGIAIAELVAFSE